MLHPSPSLWYCTLCPYPVVTPIWTSAWNHGGLRGCNYFGIHSWSFSISFNQARHKRAVFFFLFCFVGKWLQREDWLDECFYPLIAFISQTEDHHLTSLYRLSWWTLCLFLWLFCKWQTQQYLIHGLFHSFVNLDPFDTAIEGQREHNYITEFSYLLLFGRLRTEMALLCSMSVADCKAKHGTPCGISTSSITFVSFKLDHNSTSVFSHKRKGRLSPFSARSAMIWFIVVSEICGWLLFSSALCDTVLLAMIGSIVLSESCGLLPYSLQLDDEKDLFCSTSTNHTCNAIKYSWTI